jgi:hypothetical protein
MAEKNIAVFGIYHTRDAAEEAVNALRRVGFRNTDISALFPDNAGSKDFAHEKNTKAPEGATAGAASGAVAGGVLGWLVGIGFIAIPGIGPFIAAGPIISALAAAGALGTVGGMVGALVGMGIPEYEAKRYEGRVKHGGILLSVHCDSHDWAKRGADTLRGTGAEDIASTHEAHADFAASDRPIERARSSIVEERVEPIKAESIKVEPITRVEPVVDRDMSEHGNMVTEERLRTRTTGGV